MLVRAGIEELVKNISLRAHPGSCRSATVVPSSGFILSASSTGLAVPTTEKAH